MATPSELEPEWFLIDAKDIPLGRLASAIAHRLRGKHRPDCTPHLDMQIFIVVVNVEKLYFSRGKSETKFYHRYSGYQSGLTSVSLRDMLKDDPQQILYLAVKKMLSRGPLAAKRLKGLKVYAGTDHPHQAQQPKMWQLNSGISS